MARFSYPAFGWRPVKKRFKNAIVAIINEVHHSEVEKNDYDDNDNVTYVLTNNFHCLK